MGKKKENKETKRDSFVYDETQKAFTFKGIKAFENTYDTTFIRLNSGEDVSVSQLIKVYEASKKMHTSENVTLVGSDFVNNLTFQITDDCDIRKVKFIRNNTEDVTLDVLLALYDKYKANNTIDISNENDGKCQVIDLPEPARDHTWGINISPIAKLDKFFINMRSVDEKISEHLYFSELIAAYRNRQYGLQKAKIENEKLRIQLDRSKKILNSIYGSQMDLYNILINDCGTSDDIIDAFMHSSIYQEYSVLALAKGLKERASKSEEKENKVNEEV